MSVVSWSAGTAFADVLVSNIGQTEDSGEAFIDYELAQSFTTGTHAAGYTLTSIELRLSHKAEEPPRNDNNLPTVRLLSSSATGTEVAVLTGSGVVTIDDEGSEYTFTAPANTTLGMSTTYWVVAVSGVTSEVLWRYTDTGDEDGTPAAGWTIGDDAEYRDQGETGAFDSWADFPFMMRVNGTEKSSSNSTGKPTISGIPRVGETLTTTQGNIADTDGLTTATFTYQWIRVDGQNESDITGATGTTYLLTADDRGKRIKVRASFTDDAGNPESRTSDVFPAGGSIIPSCPGEVPVQNDWALIPAEVGPGDSFRLIFITSTRRNARSTDIADYKTFVQNAAARGHTAIRPYASGFRVVGSTASIDARDNTCTTGIGVPIYWLNGNKVADHHGDFYDGSWDDEVNPKNESGNNSPSGTEQWTGTAHDGTASSPAVLGRPRNGLIAFGKLDSSAGTAGPLRAGSSRSSSFTTKRLYALSPVFRVQGLENALVSNFGQSSGHPRYNVLSNASQSFTTGTHASGYHIESIATKINESRSFALSLCTADSRGRPTSTCTPFTAPSTTQTDSPVVFDAPANTILEANTTYAVVLSGFHNRLILDYTPSGQEDTTSATGWGIGDAYHLWHPGSRSWYRRSGVVLRLAVRGSPRAVSVVPGAPRDFSATPGSAQMELNWSAPSNNGGAAITDYEVRYQQGNNPATAWASAGTDRTETVTGLTTGQQYTFEVRAVNSAGNGFARHRAGHRDERGALHRALRKSPRAPPRGHRPAPLLGGRNQRLHLRASFQLGASQSELQGRAGSAGGERGRGPQGPAAEPAEQSGLGSADPTDAERRHRDHAAVAGMHGHQRGVCKREQARGGGFRHRAGPVALGVVLARAA